jgi:NAD(P)-dependent dehydrogenase (short-subunit alcohol dehydrogenase family)
MGLAVATSLSRRPEWEVHILDLKSSRTSSSIDATFHECNVADESALGRIFTSIFEQNLRLDFVFANAGIAERANFYEGSEDDDPLIPVKGMHALVDTNLKSVITTTYFASHYMRRSPKDADKSIVMTASCGGLYPSYYSPIYTATKHAVVGFMRSIAPWYYHKAGIRVNAICPGVVKTNLLSNAEWANFPEEYFTPVEKISDTVCMLVDGKDDGAGKDVGVLQGKAVEISGQKHYYRQAVEYCDEAMKAVMGSTNIEVLDHVQPA